jgi:hypothetical protein
MAVGSGLTVEVVIPSLQEGHPMFNDEQPDLVELMRSKSMRLGHANWIEPNLGHTVTMLARGYVPPPIPLRYRRRSDIPKCAVRSA